MLTRLSLDDPNHFASLALIPNEDKTKFLAIARKDDYNKFGIIGGKIDQDETLLSAMKREVLEEIGIYVIEADPIFSEPIGDKHCLTFLVKRYSGTPQSMEGPPIKWLTPEELSDRNISPFSEYNQNLFKVYFNKS